MNSSDVFGGAAGAPIGTIVSGFVNDPKWIALDGSIYNKADYPDLDTSKMLTTGSNDWVTGTTLSPTAGYNVIWIGGTIWVAHNTATASTAALYYSIDNGVNWSIRNLPFAGSSSRINFVNGVLFCFNTGVTTGFSTSTDGGATWTSRAAAGLSSTTIGATYYLNGRYILLPAYCSSTTCLGAWSTDLSTWTVFTIGSLGAAANSFYNSPCKRAAYARRSGLALFIDSKLFTSFDGLTWTQRWAYSKNTSGVFSVATLSYPQIAELDNGYLGDLSFHQMGLGTYTWVSPDLSASYIHITGTNLAIPAGSVVLSEDRGVTQVVKANQSPSTGFLYAYDFSGSRILVVDYAGVVRYIDIDATKFRAVDPRISYTQSDQINTDKLYIKAR